MGAVRDHSRRAGDILLVGAFGWDGDRLPWFEVHGVCYWPPALWDRQVGDEDTAVLQWVAAHPGATLDYSDDLGAEWRHRIEVEEVAPADPDERFRCRLDGRGRVPEEGAARSSGLARCDQTDLQLINAALRTRLGAAVGQNRPAAGGRHASDPILADLLPELAAESIGVCGCGEGPVADDDAGEVLLWPYDPVPEAGPGGTGRGRAAGPPGPGSGPLGGAGPPTHPRAGCCARPTPSGRSPNWAWPTRSPAGQRRHRRCGGWPVRFRGCGYRCSARYRSIAARRHGPSLGGLPMGRRR